MNLFIYHGENQTGSRQALMAQLEQLKQKQVQLKWLDGINLSKQDLEVELKTQNLFQAEAVIIENLLTRPRSKEKDRCLELLANFRGHKTVCLWDGKTATKSALKKLESVKPAVKLFKLPNYLFKFLDSFQPKKAKLSLKLFHQTLELANEQLVFIMLTRRLSQLIIAKTNPELVSGASWQRQQIFRQAQNWTLSQLLQFHRRFVQIDWQLKTGQTSLSLVDQLDLVILEL